MNDIETLIARIDALEMSKAHQDHTIEDLSDALAAQWKQIEALNRQIARLTEQVQEVGANAASGQAPDSPPPHY